MNHLISKIAVVFVLSAAFMASFFPKTRASFVFEPM